MLLKWLDVHIHCAIALAPGSLGTYAGPTKSNVVKGFVADGMAEQEFAPMGAKQEFAPMGTVVAGGAAEQEFAPMGAVQASPAVVQATPAVVQATPAVVVGTAATPAVVVVDKSGYA